MGPWFLRDPDNPFRPGCSYSTIKDMARRGRIKPDSVIRGPTTHQFWSVARRTPGVSHLVGLCYACQEEVETHDEICRFCGVSFEVEPDRQHLGLAPVHLLPGQAPPEAIAESTAALDPAASTAGKLPGSELPAIDDSAERLVRQLAGRLRGQRILLALLALLSFSALALVGIIIAEHRLGGPRTVSTFLLGRPSPSEPAATPVAPPPGEPSIAAPVPASAPDHTAAAAAESHSPSPAVHPMKDDPARQPGPIADALAPARTAIEEGSEASLQQAISIIEQVRREHPALAEACASLEKSARLRLTQLQLRTLP